MGEVIEMAIGATVKVAVGGVDVLVTARVTLNHYRRDEDVGGEVDVLSIHECGTGKAFNKNAVLGDMDEDAYTAMELALLEEAGNVYAEGMRGRGE